MLPETQKLVDVRKLHGSLDFDKIDELIKELRISLIKRGYDFTFFS